MANWNLPTLVDTAWTQFPEQIKQRDIDIATMFSGVTSFSNIPTGAVRFKNGEISIWDGSLFNATQLGIAGGGTGASTASGARTALGCNDASNLNTGTIPAARIGSVTYTKTPGATPLSLSGLTTNTVSDSGHTHAIAAASTSAAGVVKLNR